MRIRSAMEAHAIILPKVILVRLFKQLTFLKISSHWILPSFVLFCTSCTAFSSASMRRGQLQFSSLFPSFCLHHNALSTFCSNFAPLTNTLETFERPLEVLDLRDKTESGLIV